VHPQTVESIYRKLQDRLAYWTLREQKIVFDDDMALGADVKNWDEERPASEFRQVFGLINNNGTIYARKIFVPEEELTPIRRNTILEHIPNWPFWWETYQAVIVNTHEYYRIYHFESELPRGNRHIDMPESFWEFIKDRLIQKYGVPNGRFPTFVRESEFRFNHRNEDLYRVLLKDLRRRPL